MEKEVLEKYKEAGRIANKMRELARQELKDGIKVLDLVEKIEEAIKKEANLAFPVNFSINDVAAHYTPDINDEGIIRNGDLVKVDIGVQIDGYIADTSICVRVGEKSDPLLKASEDALEAFLKEVAPGKTVAELSSLVEEVVVSHGFNPVRNLAGHSLEQYTQHAHISIPNSKTTLQHKLKEDDVIAMEVFTTDGEGWVIESTPTLIYMFVKSGAVRMRESKMILQRVVDQYKTLPFARRWLKDIGNTVSLHMALRELVNNGILHEYPPLRERSRGMVAQAEETIIVKDKPIITTRS